ncbi:MAG TPA: hypothetical protein VMW51_00595, partial [Terriglobia bacterium]|nr:hypothetical protein [Terriglobia bacterium]
MLLRSSAAAVCLFVVALPSVCQTQASGRQSESEEDQILILKKKLAEQDRRINQLEQQVKALLANQKQPAAAEPGQTPKPAQSASAMASPAGATAKSTRVSADAAPIASGAPAHPVTQTQPEKSIHAVLAPIHFGGNVYLFQYVPLDIPGAHPQFELYAFSALLD